MYIDKYWGNFIGGSDDSLNLVAFLEDQKKEEISLSEIFAKIGLDKQGWDFHQTVEYLEFTHSNGVEMDFHFAIDVVTDLAAILLECSVSGSVNLHDLDEYNTPSRRIRITATAEEHDAMNKALADFAQNPLSYDLHEMMDDEEIQEMALGVETLREELYEAARGWTPEHDEEEPDMDILEQCQEWNENDEYQKIIDTLEAIPALERTPEMDSELARAYNNVADPYKPGGKDMLKKAITLLKPHAEYFEGDHCWNFRMGYSYFYLDQEGRALRYFEKALEARPGDEDTMELIDWCKKGISLPQFRECFRERTEDWWETFAEMEAGLRQMMDDDKDHTRGAELVAQMEETLNLVFDEISFEMGFNGEKHELILTPEGDKVKLFELVYFQKHAPKEVLEHWNILVGRQPFQNIGLRTEDGWDISGEDVQIWLEEQGENSFAISAYCEKLLPMLREAEGRVWWMLTTLTDQMLGEIPHMRYIGSFDVLEKPKEEPFILMSQLPDHLRERGLELSTDPEDYLETYLGYEMEPNKDPDADWRLDVMAGSTCCASLINGYLNADNDFMDELHADGAVAGFFCYPLDTLREEEGAQKIFDFRDKLEEVFTTGDGPEVLTLTGGATGLYCGYVDFIAWDIQTALQMAKEFFENSDIPWASFHTFRREAGTVALKKPPEEEPNAEEQASELEKGDNEDENDTDHAGVFTGFVLLSKGEWDKEQFIRDMKEKWDITVEEYDASEEKDDDALVFEVGDMLAAVSLMPSPIPGGEAEANAENNYMWEDAVKVAKEHRAHLMVAVLGKEEDLLEKGKLFTKMVAACCRQNYATGIYTSGVVFEPQFYEGFAEQMHEDELPIFNWIWFGLWRDENGMNGYTYGLDVFGKDEMEVLGTDADPNSLRDFLASLVSYVLENDVELHDGETIGFAEDDKHTITRSPGVGLPEEQITLKISWASSDGDPDDGCEGGEPQDEKSGVPEVYTEEEMEVVEGHIQQYFGKFENVFHELVSTDIHVDICVVPPSKDRDYYTLVTMGMGAHRMNVPEELAEYKLERAELAIALPKDWKMKKEDFKDARWYWPIRLLKTLARLPIASDTWLGFGHTMDHREDFAENTKLCAAILTGPQGTEDGSEVCTLPGGKEVNFYQVIPLYRDELEYKLAHDAEALLDKMDGISFVVEPDRQDAITRGTLCSGDDEDDYQAMAEVIKKRFTNWQGQDFDEDTLEPSELAKALMEYLDCECTYFPSMKDDDPIMAAYSYAKRDSAQEGFVPVLIKADDEILWECLIMNSDPDSDGEDDYAFDPDKVAEYRKGMLSASIPDGKAVLAELTDQRKEEAEDDDMDWEEEILGEMEGGYDNDRFSCYWNSDTGMTYPLILAKIPVRNPWEIFAYLPFGNWNECPDTPELMAAAKYWFEQYGAVPAAMSHDELEFDLPVPVSEENAMEAALEQYGFCPDIVDQEPEDATVGALADVLRQSTVWYFWWD